MRWSWCCCERAPHVRMRGSAPCAPASPLSGACASARRPDLRHRSHGLSAARRPGRLSGRCSGGPTARRPHGRMAAPKVASSALSVFALLSEGAGCRRGLGGGHVSLRVPLRSKDGQGCLSLRSIGDEARPANLTLRAGEAWRGAKWRATRKQAEDAWACDGCQERPKIPHVLRLSRLWTFERPNA